MSDTPNREEVEALIAQAWAEEDGELATTLTALLALAYDKDTGEKYSERAAISERLRKEQADELGKRCDFMNSRGYVRCDIPACNCDSWHGGHADRRLHEIEEAIREAGGNTNGVILTDAILALGARLSEVEKALGNIAEQKLSNEMNEDQARYADYQGAYEHIITLCRTALQHKDQQG